MRLPSSGWRARTRRGTTQRTWKARHTANVEAKLSYARRTLGVAWRYYDELEELGGRLIRERPVATVLVQKGTHALVELERHVRRPVVAHGGREGRVADEVGEEEGVVGDDHRLKGVTKL